LSEAAGALFINASDWLPDDHFADDLHADEDGTADFSKRLAAVLKPLVSKQPPRAEIERK
jgi:lysophospholipase L1-like esterase